MKTPITVLISADQIQQRVAQLGAAITDHYHGSDALLLVGLLRGSFMFIADLSRKIMRAHEVDFIAATSYGNRLTSSGEVRLVKDLESDITGKNVLIVEDIIDTGYTLSKIVSTLQHRAPKSLAICTLLDKPEQRVVEVAIRWCGFTIPDKFVIGYGVDYAQQYRHLDFIGILEGTDLNGPTAVIPR